MIATIIADVVAKLTPAYSTLTSKVGRELLAESDSPPRLIWEPTADRFDGARLQNVEPRPIHTRNAGCSVHIWGATLALTETLINDVIAALRQSVPGIYQLGAGSWVPPAKLQKGRAYVLEFSVQIPVTMAVRGTVGIVESSPGANQAVPVQDVGITFPDGTTVHGSPGV